CPEDEKTYLHRTGRTGRAGNKGTAVTFVDWDDVPRWSLIDKALDLGIPEPVETYSSSAHLYTDLHIPEGTKGRLPKERRTLAGLDAEEIEDLGETGKRHTPAGGSRGRGRSDGGRSDGRGRGEQGGRGRSGGQGRGRGAEGERTGAGGGDRERSQSPEVGTASEGGERRRRSRSRRRTRGGRPGEQDGGASAAPQPAE